MRVEHINALTASTREMGPGNKHETLNDHWASWNWQKVRKLGTHFNIIYTFQCTDVKLGVFLLQKLKDVIGNHAQQQVQFLELLDTCSESGSAKIKQWDTLIHEWEEDHTKVDPYDESEYGEWCT